MTRRVLRDEPLARYTAARLGGPADRLYVAKESLDDLIEVVTAAWKQGLLVRVLGGGANVLVSGSGARGLVVINRVDEVAFAGRTVTATSGTSLPGLARRCQSRGLGGLEWLASVPGTVGGAVVNNAGAHGGDIAGVLREAFVLDAEQGEQTLSVADLRYAYRHSRLKQCADKRFLVLRAVFELRPDDPARLLERMEDFIAHRKRTQPPGASLGSIFKNPPGDYAGRLIEIAGLKGYRVGGAQVSNLHANFFINTGETTADDYYALIQHVQAVVAEQTGVELEMEIELFGDWPQ